jgi:hypothetical protein
MVDKSIFHNIVKRETAYTQLLCNMLKRDRNFRDELLRKCGLDPTTIKSSDIEAEKRLGEYGQADILIRSSRVWLIIELKTETHRGRESTQEIEDKGKTYLGWLRAEAPVGTISRLLFLVPSEWKHRIGTAKEIEAYASVPNTTDLGVNMLLWPQLVTILHKSAGELATEFRRLIEDRYGPIGFTPEERSQMFAKEFPLTTVVKLVKLLDDVRRASKIKAELLNIGKDEIGFYFQMTNKKSCCLWVGLWPDFWNEKDQLSPICFGVADSEVTSDVKEAFMVSLKAVYNQDTISYGGYQLGYVPLEDFDEHDSVETIKPKLNKIWEAMQIASD